MHGDYDMQGVYIKPKDGGRAERVDTNGKEHREGMNHDVTPDKPMFQHGANDNHFRWHGTDEEVT